MMREMMIGAAMALALGQASASPQTAAMGPAQAIAAATAAGTAEVKGVFEMDVASTGASGFEHYLNSHADYRDAANLTIQIHAPAANDLRARLGGEVEDVLKGKRVRVTGAVHRVRLEGRDGAVHFQTRVEVDRGGQVQIVG